MTPIRVVHLITRMNVGGAAGYIVDMCRRLPRDEFAQAVITGPTDACEGSVLEQLDGTGVGVTLLPELHRAPSPLADLRALGAVRRQLAAMRPDLVHTHTAKAGWLGREAARALGIPALHHVHGWAALHQRGPARALYLTLERRAARSAARLLVVTERDRAMGLARGIGRPEQYRLARAGIDLDAIRAGGRSAAPEVRGLPGPVIGFLGRLCEQKDPLTFLAAAEALGRRRPEVRFLLVGDGPLRAQVDEAVARSDLGERLVRLPLREDVPALLAGLSALAHPSRHEGLPRLLLEALALGVPIAATEVDGCAELLLDHPAVRRVRPGDPIDLARALGELLDERTPTGEECARVETLLEPFAIGRCADQLASVYREVLRESRASS